MDFLAKIFNSDLPEVDPYRLTLVKKGMGPNWKVKGDKQECLSQEDPWNKRKVSRLF
jgi:hypothetical protein